MLLPGDWKEAHEPDHYRYVDDGRGEEVIVSVLQSRAPIDSVKLASLTKELIAIRQDSIRQLSANTAEFDAIRSSVAQGGIDVELTGVDPKNQVQFAVFIRGRALRTVTASYIKYTPLLPKNLFAARAREVLGGLHVK